MQAAIETVEICSLLVLEVALSAEAFLSAESEHQGIVGDFVDLERILDLVAWRDVELVGKTEPAVLASSVYLRRNASNASQRVKTFVRILWMIANVVELSE